MGKMIKNERNNPKNKNQIESDALEAQICESSSKHNQNYVQFFEFLKQFHGLEGKKRSKEPSSLAILSTVSIEIVDFFNKQKDYTKQELQRYTICLANLLNVMGQNIIHLQFEHQFKSKIRRFLSEIASQDQEQTNLGKIKAILYILVALIYKERIGQIKHFKELNKQIFSDKILVKYLLSLKLPKDKKISKFYGIIIIYLSNLNKSQKMKKDILSSIISNLSKIEHDATFFNLLVFLRNEKNKIRMNLGQIMKGQLIEYLIQSFPRFINRYQSYFILDYLNHLLLLFPSLTRKVDANFIQILLETSTRQNFHHPLQEFTIISFIHSTLKYTQAQPKNIILDKIINAFFFNSYLALKLAYIIFDYEISNYQLIKLASSGYFDQLLEMINQHTQINTLSKTVQLYMKISSKISQRNISIGNYILSNLHCKLKMLKNRGVNYPQLSNHLLLEV